MDLEDQWKVKASQLSYTLCAWQKEGITCVYKTIHTNWHI